MTAPRPTILAAIAAGATPPGPPHPDAEILALGAKMDAAFAAYLAFRPRELAARSQFGADHAETMDAAIALIDRGFFPMEAAFRLPPPTTLAGVAVLARGLAAFKCELWDGPLSDLDDIGDRILRLTVEAVLALAGVDRLGRPVEGGR